ncbi:MAG: hypothetical protein IPK26_27360 [Planctomycetes bacterium]|nr:hypothetical protein [Planctomycetota bacterium]
MNREAAEVTNHVGPEENLEPPPHFSNVGLPRPSDRDAGTSFSWLNQVADQRSVGMSHPQVNRLPTGLDRCPWTGLDVSLDRFECRRRWHVDVGNDILKLNSTGYNRMPGRNRVERVEGIRRVLAP